MSYVAFEKAKKHLEVFHSEDDETIQDCLDDAESWAAAYMNRPDISDGQAWTDTLEEETSESSSNGQLVPGAVVRAILMKTAEFYEMRRESVVGVSFTKTTSVEDMLHLFRLRLGV